MSKVGRNDPCPCGSGNKYKRCCLGKEEVAPATSIRAVDGVVTQQVVGWVLRKHQDRAEAMRPLLPESLWTSEAAGMLLTMLLAYETTADDGTRLCLEIPETVRRDLDPRERRWLESQQESWFSLWDVIEVRRDEGLFLRDLFTAEERFVREARATHYVHDRDVLLARTVRLDQTWTLAASHPHILAPHAADAVATEARRVLKLGRGKVDPDRLRGEAAFRLVALWDEEVQAGLAAPRPALRNTEGHPLVLTEDVFAFEPEQRDALRMKLHKLPEADEDEEESTGDVARFAVFAPGEEPTTLVADVVVEERRLVVNTNSTRRADHMRTRLEEYLGALVRFVERTESDPWDRLDEEGFDDEEPAEPEIPPEEAARMILAYKENHYGTWPDIPLPALDGMTPRDAARDKRRKVYRTLDVVLRDIERGESREPLEQRYDVQALRRELGM